jgi:hypothetical protein
MQAKIAKVTRLSVMNLDDAMLLAFHRQLLQTPAVCWSGAPGFGNLLIWRQKSADYCSKDECE